MPEEEHTDKSSDTSKESMIYNAKIILNERMAKETEVRTSNKIKRFLRQKVSYLKYFLVIAFLSIIYLILLYV